MKCTNSHHNSKKHKQLLSQKQQRQHVALRSSSEQDPCFGSGYSFILRETPGCKHAFYKFFWGKTFFFIDKFTSNIMVWYRYLICIMSHFLAYPVPDTHKFCEKKKAESHSQTTKQCDRAFQTERSVYLNVRVRGADDVVAPGRTAGCPVWSAHCCSPCRTGGWGEKNVK